MKCLVQDEACVGAGGAEEEVFGGRCFGPAPAAPATIKLRPTMISAKYRLKEERRKVLKISISKLRKIEDPESSLHRSVLINNTMKRLQREAREEKLQKQFPNAKPASAYRPEPPSTPTPPPQPPMPLRRGADKENAAPDALRQSTAKTDVVRQSTVKLEDVVTSESAPRKRSYDEVEDCDVQDVLSQFYMPPTPRMLTSIDDTDDEDEDVNVVDIDISAASNVSLACTLQHEQAATNEVVPKAKRPRLEEDEVVDPLEMLAGLSDGSATGLSAGSDDIDMSLALEVAEAPSTREDCETLCRTFLPSEDSVSNDGTYPCRTRSELEPFVISAANGVCNSADNTTDGSSEQHQYSCGHSSMFGEIQSVVYHSLITSLES